MSEQGVFTRFLEALSDPIRMQIVFLLHDQARLNVGEIASRFRISRPAGKFTEGLTNFALKGETFH
jgi:ArsR family transcriptional regulator